MRAFNWGVVGEAGKVVVYDAGVFFEFALVGYVDFSVVEKTEGGFEVWILEA